MRNGFVWLLGLLVLAVHATNGLDGNLQSSFLHENDIVRRTPMRIIISQLKSDEAIARNGTFNTPNKMFVKSPTAGKQSLRPKNTRRRREIPPPVKREIAQPQPPAVDPGINSMAIYLGTSYIRSGYIAKGALQTLTRADPSVIAVNGPDIADYYFGFQAKEFGESYPPSSIAYATSMLDKTFSDVVEYFSSYSLPYEPLGYDSGSSFYLLLESTDITRSIFPIEILGKFIANERNKLLSREPNAKLTYLMTTLPGWLHEESIINKLSDEARKAGFSESIILSDLHPIALNTIAQGEKEKCLLFKFDAGFFDMARFYVNETGDLKVDNMYVSNYGGMDIDSYMMDYFVEKIKDGDYDDDTETLVENVFFLNRLREQCKLIKTLLTEREIATLEIRNPITSFKYNFEVTRELFEETAETFFEGVLNVTTDFNEFLGDDADNIKRIYMIGETSRIPKFRSIVKEIFPDIPIIPLDDDTILDGLNLYLINYKVPMNGAQAPVTPATTTTAAPDDMEESKRRVAKSIDPDVDFEDLLNDFFKKY